GGGHGQDLPGAQTTAFPSGVEDTSGRLQAQQVGFVFDGVQGEASAVAVGLGQNGEEQGQPGHAPQERGEVAGGHGEVDREADGHRDQDLADLVEGDADDHDGEPAFVVTQSA